MIFIVVVVDRQQVITHISDVGGLLSSDVDGLLNYSSDNHAFMLYNLDSFQVNLMASLGLVFFK